MASTCEESESTANHARKEPVRGEQARAKALPLREGAGGGEPGARPTQRETAPAGGKMQEKQTSCYPPSQKVWFCRTTAHH